MTNKLHQVIQSNDQLIVILIVKSDIYSEGKFIFYLEYTLNLRFMDSSK